MFEGRIEGVFGIESPEDVLKLLDEKIINQKLKLNQQERKLLEQQRNVAGKKGSKDPLGDASADGKDPSWLKDRSLTGKIADIASFGATKNMGKTGSSARAKAAGSPREGAAIEGFDSPNMGGGDKQPGTAVQTESSPLPMSKTWFVDNFGMQGNEIMDLLVKSGRDELIEVIQPLIVQERMALLKSFPSVSPDLVHTLPFTDFDWEMLQKNHESLAIPFRRFVKSWNDGNEESYEIWSNRISKTERLSLNERKVLEKAQEVLDKNGSMNTQALQSHGVPESTTKIAMLIKSHGFLYDIESLGSGSKNNDRALFYGLKKHDIFVKDAGALIGDLYEMGGKIEISPRGTPRLILPFNSKVCKEYAHALNTEMGVRGIIAEGNGLVIEGETSVVKAIDASLPHLKEKKGEVNILKKALEDDEEAIMCLTYAHSKPQKQVRLLKSWNMSLEAFEEMKEVVANG